MSFHVYTGTAAPTITPSNVGDHFIDTVGGDTYISVGTSSSADWKITNSASVHDLGGASHNADTLANLNTLVSDATLDDVSGSRPPNGSAGGGLGGTYPNPTVDDGADGTAIHDNVSGEISAITEKTTPVSADLIVIEDSAASNSKKRVQIGNLPVSDLIRDVFYTAADFELPINSDWVVNNLAELEVDSNNSSILVRGMSDAFQEGYGFSEYIHADAITMEIVTITRAETAPGGAVTAKLDLYFKEFPSTVSAWSSAVALTDVSLGANENWVYTTHTITLASESIGVSRMVQFQVVRDTGDAGDTLAGNLNIVGQRVRFSR